MRDQADKLRQIISNIKKRQNEQSAKNITIPKKHARVITITSGKGGVGKTNITANLAISLSQLGNRVIVIDADLGLANVDVMLGIVPKYSLADVVKNERNILEILCDGPKNIKFISGGSGVEELTKLDKKQLEKFIENIGLLDKLADIILIDTGAGISETVLSFVMAADEIIVVTTTEPTSITDAYALIKMVSNRDKNKLIKIIANKADNEKEANDVLRKISLVAERFLSIKLNNLGYIVNDDNVPKAVKQQQPFSIAFPKTNAAKQIKDISHKIIQLNQKKDIKLSEGIKGFVNRFVSFINKQ